MTTKIVESMGIESSSVPIDTGGVAQTGQRLNLKYYGKISFIITQGAWAAGTAAVTLQQHDAVSAGNSKALPFQKYWQKSATSPGVFTENPVTNNTFDLPGSANTLTVVEVDAEDLDNDNDFTYVSLNTGSPGAGASLISIDTVLGGSRYMGSPDIHVPDAKV